MDFARKKKKTVKKNSRLTALIFKIGLFFLILSSTFIYLVTKPSQGRFNILLIGENVLLVSLEKNQNTATVVSIPQNTMLSGTFAKGSVLAGSLYKLDSVSKQKGHLVDTTIREFLGVPIDGFVLIDKNLTIDNKDKFLETVNGSLGIQSNIFPTKKTNLTLIGASRFYYNLGKIRPDKINFINLIGSALTTQTFPDGSQSLQADEVSLDSYLNARFNEWDILKEGLSIAVFNGTNEPGLASRASRIIHNIGGNVIQVSESPERVVNCIIYVPLEHQNAYTVKRIKNIFDCSVTTKTIEGNRGDVAVVVGSSYNQQVKE